jgi:hypothetical protein
MSGSSILVTLNALRARERFASRHRSRTPLHHVLEPEPA